MSMRSLSMSVGRSSRRRIVGLRTGTTGADGGRKVVMTGIEGAKAARRRVGSALSYEQAKSCWSRLDEVGFIYKDHDLII